MSGNHLSRHPAISGVKRTHMLGCGCESYAPGHSIHYIQARLFSECPPEKILDVQLESWSGNSFTLIIDGERRTAQHASVRAVTDFCTIAERAEPGHLAFFTQSSMLAAAAGETSAALYPAFKRLQPCTGESSQEGGHSGLIWIDQN